MEIEDDYYQAFPEDKGHERPFAPQPPSPPPARVVASPFPFPDPASLPVRQFVYGHHLIRGYVSTTVAPGGVGKSSLGIAEALAMASGRDLLGHHVHGGPKKVWLYNLEDPLDELFRRVMATCLRYSLKEHDIAGRLYVDSGREQSLCTAIFDKGGVKIQHAVTDAFIAELRAKEIDVVIIDPLVSSHRVPENDNGAMDAVAKEWGRIAGEAGCAISIIHHTKKLGGADATSESSRGASSLVNAARDARAINRMTPEQANQYELENSRLYFRVISDKSNLAPPPDESDWYHLTNVELGNGDQVGVVERWFPPDLTEGFSVEDLRLVQSLVQAGNYRTDVRATDWVGLAVGTAVGLDPEEPASKKRIKSMLALWFGSGALVTIADFDARRRRKEFVRVGKFA